MPLFPRQPLTFHVSRLELHSSRLLLSDPQDLVIDNPLSTLSHNPTSQSRLNSLTPHHVHNTHPLINNPHNSPHFDSHLNLNVHKNTHRPAKHHDLAVYPNSSSSNLTQTCEIYTTAATETRQVSRSAGDGIRLALSSSMIRFGTGVSGPATATATATATASGAVGIATASRNQTDVLQSSGAVGRVQKKWRILGLMLCVWISFLGAN
ncbi:hypothetical protein V8E51_018815 [Hyaloscypha variabilis]